MSAMALGRGGPGGVPPENFFWELFGAFWGFRVRKNAHSILKESKINQQHQSKKQYREYRIYRYTNIHNEQTCTYLLDRSLHTKSANPKNQYVQNAIS